VVHGIGGGCDEEALRMVAGMPRWKPGKQNGIPVKVYFTIPIKFVLN
jgi:protein TonB